MKKLPVLNQAEAKNDFTFQSLADFARSIYLDNNATTQTDDDAITAMLRSFEIDYANPSGMHEAGRIAQKNIEQARVDVANFIGCLSQEIVFTSCGTEGINSVINSVMKTNYPRRHIITSAIEHGATLNKLKDIEGNLGPAARAEVSYLDVDKTGNISIEQLEAFLSKNPIQNLLVSLMAANNETGTINNILNEAIILAHKYGAMLHIDAVQVAGKLPLRPYIDMGTDFLTISGHKFHAPKGIGAIYVKQGIPFHSFILGGSQEYGRRAGTENVPAIIGLGIVAKKMPQVTDKMKILHEKFISGLTQRIPSIIINGGGVPGTINVGFRYVHREAMVVKLSEYGVYASVGSACAKGIDPSHVLKAMKVPKDYIHGSVRFSLSKYTTEYEISKAIDIIVKTYNEIRSLSLGIIP